MTPGSCSRRCSCRALSTPTSDDSNHDQQEDAGAHAADDGGQVRREPSAVGISNTGREDLGALGSAQAEVMFDLGRALTGAARQELGALMASKRDVGSFVDLAPHHRVAERHDVLHSVRR